VLSSQVARGIRHGARARTGAGKRTTCCCCPRADMVSHLILAVRDLSI